MVISEAFTDGKDQGDKDAQVGRVQALWKARTISTFPCRSMPRAFDRTQRR